jgi:hypothetical protein
MAWRAGGSPRQRQRHQPQGRHGPRRDLGLSPGSAGRRALPGRPAARHGHGRHPRGHRRRRLNVFDPDEDPAAFRRPRGAQTAISGGIREQVNLEGVRVRLGPARLTPQSADTSLGAVLDEITPGTATGRRRRPRRYRRLGTGASLAGLTDDTPATSSRRAAAATPVYVQAYDPMALAFGGAALGGFVMLLYGLYVLISAVVGASPGYFRTAPLWMPAIIGLGIALVFAIIGAIAGRAGVARPLGRFPSSDLQKPAVPAPRASSFGTRCVGRATAQKLQLSGLVHLNLVPVAGTLCPRARRPQRANFRSHGRTSWVEWAELGQAKDTVLTSGAGATVRVQDNSHPPHGGSLMARMHALRLSFLGLAVLMTGVGCVPQEKYNAARLALDAANERFATADAQAKAASAEADAYKRQLPGADGQRQQPGRPGQQPDGTTPGGPRPLRPARGRVQGGRWRTPASFRCSRRPSTTR